MGPSVAEGPALDDVERSRRSNAPQHNRTPEPIRPATVPRLAAGAARSRTRWKDAQASATPGRPSCRCVHALSNVLAPSRRPRRAPSRPSASPRRLRGNRLVQQATVNASAEPDVLRSGGRSAFYAVMRLAPRSTDPRRSERDDRGERPSHNASCPPSPWSWVRCGGLPNHVRRCSCPQHPRRGLDDDLPIFSCQQPLSPSRRRDDQRDEGQASCSARDTPL